MDAVNAATSKRQSADPLVTTNLTVCERCHGFQGREDRQQLHSQVVGWDCSCIEKTCSPFIPALEYANVPQTPMQSASLTKLQRPLSTQVQCTDWLLKPFSAPM